MVEILNEVENSRPWPFFFTHMKAGFFVNKKNSPMQKPPDNLNQERENLFSI